MLRTFIAVFLAVAGASAGAAADAAPKASPKAAAPAAGFEVRKLAEGVYAAMRTEPPGFAVDCNVVFIINDADVIVVDANDTPSSARQVLAALKKLTSKPVTYLVNTHWHDDHIIGDAVYREAFPGVEIVAHAKTREYLPTKGIAARADMKKNASDFAGFLRGILEKNVTTGGRPLEDEERAAYSSDLRLAERYSVEFPQIRILLPTLTLQDRLTLYRGSRTIDIRYLGRGHTSGDIVVHLPEERILVTGDLVVWPVPLVGGDQSHVGDWSETLQKLIALQATTIVPGHGPVLHDDAYLRQMADLFSATKQRTEAAIARGESLEAARKSVDLEDFRVKFAGESKLRTNVFRSYVSGPAVESAYADAKEGRAPDMN